MIPCCDSWRKSSEGPSGDPMKAREWREFLEGQKSVHGKNLFTVTELANAAAVGRNVVNVELSRLRRQGIVTRYAQGLYGLPGAVTEEELLVAIDNHAYLTGIYALHLHELITQIPTAITCFTDRRSPRARIRKTPVGRFIFVCVRSRIYAPPPGVSTAGRHATSRPLAGPEQALCDFVYLCRRNGVVPASQITFRSLQHLDSGTLLGTAERYPSTVREEVLRIIGTTLPR